MMSSPSFDHIRSFLVVARHLHFARAAAVLGLTQPAVSGHIRRLELALGTPLLDRSTRAVALTPTGAAFASRMRDVVDGFDFAVADAQPTGNDPSPLRIACTPTAATLAPRLRTAASNVSNLPVVDVQWEIDVLAGLRDGHWPFAVGHALRSDHQDIHVTHLRDDALHVIASGRLSDELTSLRDLASAELVLPPAELAPGWDARLRSILTSIVGHEPTVRDVPVTNAMCLDDLLSHVDASGSQLGAYTVVPASGVPPHVRSVSLAPVAVPLVLIARRTVVRQDAQAAQRSVVDLFAEPRFSSASTPVRGGGTDADSY